jgi:hypothetical protein
MIAARSPAVLPEGVKIRLRRCQETDVVSALAKRITRLWFAGPKYLAED